MAAGGGVGHGRVPLVEGGSRGNALAWHETTLILNHDTLRCLPVIPRLNKGTSVAAKGASPQVQPPPGAPPPQVWEGLPPYGL